MPIYKAEDLDEARFLLHGLPLFELMPSDVRRLVSDSFEAVRLGFGDIVYEEGDESEACYVVRGGQARSLKVGDDGEEVSLALLTRGDFFGEREMLDGTPRQVTVRAAGDLSLFRLDRGVFRALLKQNPELRKYVAG